MNFERYFAGFMFSSLCTLAAFAAVEYYLRGSLFLSKGGVIAAIFILALIQIGIQLVCFLKVNFSRESRARVAVLTGAFVVVCILLSGSLWIMVSLSEHMTPNSLQMEQYMGTQNGF